MWGWLLRQSIRHTAFTMAIVAAMAVVGVYGLLEVQVDAVPDITNNQVQVYAYAPGYSALEVELLVTRPIEAALATLPDRVEWRSISRMGLSLVTVVFAEGTDLYRARAQITERLLAVREQLPPGIQPEIGPLSTGLSEAYQYILRPAVPVSLTELRAIQDWVVRRSLLEVPGVADISSFGGYVRRWEICLRPEALQRYQITLTEVEEALRATHQLIGIGFIERSGTLLSLRVEGLWRSPQDIIQSVVARRHDRPIRLMEVGYVREGHLPRYGALLKDTLGEAVGGIVLVRRGENTAEVVRRLKERIRALEPRLPYGIRLEPFLDREELIRRLLRTVAENLLKAALIVIGLLTLLLGSWRGGLIVGLVIPLAMFFALGLMALAGISANLMSLGAIDFGLIVDGAVILVEAVLVRLPLVPERRQAAEEGAIQIRQASLFGELVVLAVYLPLLLLSGVEGKMFRPMVLTMMFALLGALILALTFVPWAAARWLRPSKSRLAETIHGRIHAFSLWLFRQGLRRPFWPIGAWLVLLGAALWSFLRAETIFLPELDEGAFAVETRLPPGTPLEHTIAYCQAIHRLLLTHFSEAFSGAVAKIGTSEIPMDPMFVESADLILTRRPSYPLERSALADSFKSLIVQHYPGVFIGVQQPIQMRFNELLAGARTDIVIRVIGPDLDTLRYWGERIADYCAKVKGVADLARPYLFGTRQFVIRWKPEALAFYGVSLGEAQRWLQALRVGLPLAPLLTPQGWRFPVAIRLEGTETQLAELPIPTQDGKWVPLGQIATLTQIPSYNEIPHAEGERSYSIGIGVRGRGVLTVVEALKAYTDTLALPSGYRISFGGNWQNYLSARERLFWVVPTVVLLIGGLMYATLGRFSAVLLVLVVSLAAAGGGMVALTLRGLPFSLSAAIGLISAYGLATLNGTVLLNRYLSVPSSWPLRRMREALIERSRPILATALVAMAGLAPMAISTQAGAEVQRPFATAIIGGLAAGAFFNLWLLPVLYSFFWRRK
ncbi:MAG: CusA/CzcA family heavy metal efflux RND transporter [Bacteroidia bacterium]